MNSAVTNSASVCAARFRSSWDLAMTSVLIETATNNRPARLAAAVPARVANVPHFSNRIGPGSDRRCARDGHVAGAYRRAPAITFIAFCAASRMPSGSSTRRRGQVSST
jgi:hypothetical protein